jgi:SAM-dependent methyltransferase
MIAKLLKVCPGCGSAFLSAPLLVEAQPVILNYRFASVEESTKVPLRPIALVECGDCGLIFNSAFEEGIVPYDERYENRQSHSEAFANHISKAVRIIGALVDSETPRFLEVGCGKGEFLRKIVDSFSGSGEGWDTSFEGNPAQGAVIYYKEYLSAEKVQSHFDAVICRHVVEHVPPIGSFLKELASIARAATCPYVFLETPRLEWILENKSAWDVFYEHCNYFTERALASLCRKAGFKVLGQFPVFAQEYQLVVLALERIAEVSEIEEASTRFASINPLKTILSDSIPLLASLISGAREDGPWAIWGAGAKGVCLVNRLPSAGLVRVFDTNPSKQGFFIPGTQIPIVAPTPDHLENLRLIVISNPAYENEIRNSLNSFNYRGEVLVLTENLL